MALKVHDLERSIAFYRDLFEVDPDKVKGGYARFNLVDPPVVLTLNAASKVRRGDRIDHMGIKVSESGKLARAYDRLRQGGYWVKEQRGIVCCHSRQDKFWVRDPDGIQWEFYELLDDMLESSDRGEASTTAR